MLLDVRDQIFDSGQVAIALPVRVIHSHTAILTVDLTQILLLTMNFRSLILAFCLTGGVFSWAVKAEAEPPVLAQVENTELSESLPWELFSPTAGKYVIDLPGNPEQQIGTSTILDRELEWNVNSVLVSAIDEVDLFEFYLVAYIDIPRKLRYEFSQKELLDATVASIIQDIEDEQISSTLEIEEIAFQGLPSRFLTAQGFGQYFAVNVSITDDRVYLLLGIDDDAANFEHFYNSFSLVP